MDNHFLTAALPAFLASLVEFVEALTIVLAVGITRGWRSALIGCAAASVLLAVLILALGPALRAFPIAILQIVVGVLLLFFGMRWLRKAILRYAGIISLHDEQRAFEAARARLHEPDAARRAFDWLGATTAFKAVVLEGLEVVFIVIALGATAGQLVPASIGAAAAGGVVIVAGLALHSPLARVPENSLKFAVGSMLSAFGTYWSAEGLGFDWPGKDLALFYILAGFLMAAALSYALARRAKAAGAHA